MIVLLLLAVTPSPRPRPQRAPNQWPERIGLVVLVLGIFAVLVLGMYAGYRRRVRTQPELAPLPAPPDPLGRALTPPAEGLYVGTVAAGQWLDKIAAYGLNDRSRATLTATRAGLHLDREGAQDLFIPAADVLDARVDKALAGKVISAGGLVVIRWRLEDRELETGFRADDRAKHPLLAEIAGFLTAGDDAEPPLPQPRPPEVTEPEQRGLDTRIRTAAPGRPGPDPTEPAPAAEAPTPVGVAPQSVTLVKAGPAAGADGPTSSAVDAREVREQPAGAARVPEQSAAARQVPEQPAADVQVAERPAAVDPLTAPLAEVVLAVRELLAADGAGDYGLVPAPTSDRDRDDVGATPSTDDLPAAFAVVPAGERAGDAEADTGTATRSAPSPVRTWGAVRRRGPRPAVLVLEDGRTFHGQSYGAVGETFGEAVFSTAMSGYQETLTDPSFHRQVVVMTAPQIGNTGVNDEDPESGRIWVAGFVVRDPSRTTSSWRAQRSLVDELDDNGVVGISGVDTRALTRHLRERGAMRVGISSTATDPAELLDRVRRSPQMVGAELASQVSTQRPYVVPAVGERRFRVAALDLGIKRSTPARMAERGVEVHVLPATATAADLLAENPNGVFLSNGPGDPATADAAVAAVQGVLDAGVAVFGICFGNQVLGRALGFGTYKLGYGHRGVNQPVQDRATGRVAVTSHNHGFAVDAPINGSVQTPRGEVVVSHVGLNDNVVEGLRCLDTRAFSVQYHPEAAPGPHDATGLFDEFCTLMSKRVM